jgi:PAS domain S-box-containing protein
METPARNDAQLRIEARQRLAGAPAGQRSADESIDPLRLIHELRVHQIELEMQNELLSDTLSNVNALRAKYHDLYDFAPVGYFTLDRAGGIVELNLRAASLLGQQRAQLPGRQLSDFIDPCCLPAWRAFFTQAQQSAEEVFAQSLQVLRRSPMPVYVNAQARAFVDPASG